MECNSDMNKYHSKAADVYIDANVNVDGVAMSIAELGSLATPPSIVIQKYRYRSCQTNSLVFYIKSDTGYEILLLMYLPGGYYIENSEEFCMSPEFTNLLYDKIKITDVWQLNDDQLRFIGELLQYYVHSSEKTIKKMIARLDAYEPKSE